jgi:hypothetical protein
MSVFVLELQTVSLVSEREVDRDEEPFRECL